MLDQLIYTRCLPSIDLLSGGKLKPGADGYGVFTASKELLSRQDVDFRYLMSRLAETNGSEEKQVGLLESYEYMPVGRGVYAVSCENVRPQNTQQRKNGRSLRPYSHIKQCLVGNPAGYPFAWFGASVWDAHLRSELDYYQDDNPNAAPPALPRVEDTPEGGSVTLEAVRRFVSDGRAETVKQAVWFLLSEYDKPEEERKVLVIRDEPRNVELWIAAMEYGMSAPMAQQIPFATNVTRLAAQSNSVLFDYVDDSGRIGKLNRSIQQKRRPRAMIAGYHPADNLCTAFRQMAASDFVILDGREKRINLQPDASLNRQYYLSLVRYDEDLQDFCNVVLPGLPVRTPTLRIPDLFDAYKYLLDSNHTSDKWTYRDTQHHLGVLLQFGMPTERILASYLVDQGVRAYKRFQQEDEAQGYLLLRSLWSLANLVDKKDDVIGCLADRISVALNTLKNSGSELVASWEAIRGANLQNIVNPALVELFNDGELPVYKEQFVRSRPEAIATVLDMYFCMLRYEGSGIQGILKSDVKFGFVCSGVNDLRNNQQLLQKVLRELAEVPELINSIAMRISYTLNKNPALLTQWWDSILAAIGGDIVELCRNIAAAPDADVEMIEGLLASRVHKSGACSDSILKAFANSVQKLGRKETTGQLLFPTWIDVRGREDAEYIVDVIGKFGLPVSTQKKLFAQLDGKLPYNPSAARNISIYQKMDNWGHSLDLKSRSSLLYQFCKQLMVKDKKGDRLDYVIQVVDKMGCMEFPMPEHFCEQECFRIMVDCANYYACGELHLDMLMLFRFRNETEQSQYVERYAGLSLERSRQDKRIQARTVISLYEAILYNDDMTGWNERTVRKVQELLETSVRSLLPQYYRPGLADYIDKGDDCSDEVRDVLLPLLDKIENAMPRRGLGGLIDNLFGRH